MKLSTSSRGGSGVLFAEDFDDEDGMLLDREVQIPSAPAVDAEKSGREKSAPVEESFSAADLAQSRQAGHEAGYAEALASAAEAASVTRTSLLATITERLSAARGDLDAMVAQQLGAVTEATLAIVSACLPVLCEQAGTRDLMAVLEGLLPSLVGEPELVVTVHPDFGATIEQELLPVLGKNTPLQVQTCPSMGRSDVEVAWKSGSAKRNARALRREVIQTLRRSLRGEDIPVMNKEHRHGR